ncbi:hypothetical protein IFM58399_08438 [Aspergillus lentulus]|uniref:uncharacterized protein n=1 Tax=Aspergillus lentulus TaxID=293939 RepID=UPI001395C2E2|nr:uncharacterized protein IFM58399_08438 [Aspergillus lentulus]GFF48968.1 hypothetical protein IFM58399_08438 [Aspergillus lentulus]
MPDVDDNNLTNALSAASALIGYIGTEAGLHHRGDPCFAVPLQRFTPEKLAEEDEEDLPRASFYLENGQHLQIISGPIHIIRPFFRHYEHLKRQRWNELARRFHSMHAPPFQCMWTGYTLYVTFALYISRYMHGELWLTTEERIAEALVHAEEHPGPMRILFKVAEDYVLQVDLSRTVHNSFGLAQEHAFRIFELQAVSETPTACS